MRATGCARSDAGGETTVRVIECFFALFGLLVSPGGCRDFWAEETVKSLGEVKTRVMADGCEGRWAVVDLAGLEARAWPTVTKTSRGVVILGGEGTTGEVLRAVRIDENGWSALQIEGQPRGRRGHTAVWVNDRLCVWGGAESEGESASDVEGAGSNVGACWNPHEDRWTAISSVGAPSVRRDAAGARVAGGMFIFGGRDALGDALGDGAIYDPERDVWVELPGSGPRARYGAVAASFGTGQNTEVLVWGGAGEALALGAEDAAFWNSHGWTVFDAIESPSVREGPGVAALETGLLVWGREQCVFFDAVTHRWLRIDPEAMPSPRWGATVIVTDTSVLVWGGQDENGYRGDGACWSATTRRWSTLPAGGAPSPRADAVGAFVGGRALVLWGRDSQGLRAEGYAFELTDSR